MKPAWNQLLAIAEREVKATLTALPVHLREEAQRLPIVYEPLPSAELQADGVEADTLGLFVGEPFGEAESDAVQLPAQIILYLENLWDCADGDEEIYREELRITCLHELGHYLGLEEIDLEERGLD